MWRRVFLHLYFVVLLCQSVTYISGNPLRNDKIEKQQELVGKIVDLIKREQIRMNLIEEDKGDFFQQNQNFLAASRSSSGSSRNCLLVIYPS